MLLGKDVFKVGHYKTCVFQIYKNIKVKLYKQLVGPKLDYCVETSNTRITETY